MILLDTSGLLAALDSGQQCDAEAGHADLKISLADASIVVLGARHGTRDVLTLDERHFRVLGVDGMPFRLLPTDA